MPVEPSLSVRRPERKILTDDVYETVKGLIMDRAIEPGARVNIDWLARELAVSQTPIRESLARLEADGLVVKQALRGYSTTPLLSRSELEDLYAFRLLIEPWAAGRAAERAGRPTRERLRAEMDTCASAPDRSDYETYRTMAGHDARFHSLVAELSGNAPLQTAFERSHCHLHVFRLYYDRQIGNQALPEHRRVVRAINSGDPTAAEAAMREHLERSLARLRPAADAT